MLVFLYQLKIVKPKKSIVCLDSFCRRTDLPDYSLWRNVLFSVEECHEEAVSLREIYF